MKESTKEQKAKRNREIAQVIISQLSPHGYGAVKAMLGVKTFVAIDNGLQFKFKGSRKYNMLKIVLNGRDLYDIELLKVSNPTKRNGYTYKSVVVDSLQDAYFDMLRPYFEEKTGLYTSL